MEESQRMGDRVRERQGHGCSRNLIFYASLSTLASHRVKTCRKFSIPFVPVSEFRGPQLTAAYSMALMARFIIQYHCLLLQ